MSNLQEIIDLSEKITKNSDQLVSKIMELSYQSAYGGGVSPLIFVFTVFILACFVGYFVHYPIFLQWILKTFLCTLFFLKNVILPKGGW